MQLVVGFLSYFCLLRTCMKISSVVDTPFLNKIKFDLSIYLAGQHKPPISIKVCSSMKMVYFFYKALCHENTKLLLLVHI